MKCKSFFLLLFLIPSVIHASLNKDQCEEIYKQALTHYGQSTKVLEGLKNDFDAMENNINVLNQSIALCQKGIDDCNKVINDIANEQMNMWRFTIKGRCEESKQIFKNQLDKLIEVRKREYSFRYIVLSEEGSKKASLAKAKKHEHPYHLNNIEIVVADLDESAKLYDEAVSLAKKALDIFNNSSKSNDGARRAELMQDIEMYQQAAKTCQSETNDWPEIMLAKKIVFKERLGVLREEGRIFEEKGLKRSLYEVHQRMVPILEQLIEDDSEVEKEKLILDLKHVKTSVELFETEADKNRLTEIVPLLSSEEFRAVEQQRRELFFKNELVLTPNIFLQTCLQNQSRPFAISLDGQIGNKGKDFTLYTGQFYRFLVQSDNPASHLLVKVHEKEKVVYEEKIALPLKKTLSWDRYVRTDGMVFIPNTKLKTEFGLDLRINFVCDPKRNFSLIIAQKGIHSAYQFSISLDEKESLYDCTFSELPPWQLGVLRKPALPRADRSMGNTLFSATANALEDLGKQGLAPESVSFPILDQFVEELKGDPLLLAAFVYNEIALFDPFVHQENGVFQASGIQRNAYLTYLDKLGSPWEQCQLLVYLLRKAGYKAVYAMGVPCSLPKAFIEKMLLTQLPEDQKEALVQYPWVLFFNGKEWVSLFPWMKELQVQEGHDLYNYMPEEYASIDRWILRYLKGDEKILKFIGSDGDDTAGVLFIRFVEEELRKQGLSLADVGIHRTQLKKQFESWKDFPRPEVRGEYKVLESLDDKDKFFAKTQIQFISHENPQKKFVSKLFYPADTINGFYPLRFLLTEATKHSLHVGTGEKGILDLDQADQHVDIKVTYGCPVGSGAIEITHTFSIAKGTTAALCFHFGGINSQASSLLHEKFVEEKKEQDRITNLLAYIAAAYFEKCGRAEKTLADLHKVIPATVCSFGLTKFSPNFSNDPLKASAEPNLPQVDMVRLTSSAYSDSSSAIWNQEMHTASRQWMSLTNVDSSSNEHQILREVFEDPDAISTVKLLQLAHREQQKKGLPEEGFLIFTPQSLEAAENTPEAAQKLYFPHLKELDLSDIKNASPAEWNAIKRLLDPKKSLSDFAYAYVTPGPTRSLEGNYKEMGALIFHPDVQWSLISNHHLLLNGGLGSPLPGNYFTPQAISQWQLVPQNNSYVFRPSTLPERSESTSTTYSPGTKKWSEDVRPWYKTAYDSVSDPVDVITGSFYIDEVDLILPGTFPLEIRRNYNSQNPLITAMGCGWKLSLNPFLIEQDGKMFAAETDGTVIAYSFNSKTSRWEVSPEDNPELGNFNSQGIGSTANPYHAYIENNILYGSDGSKRFFEDGLLKKWVNARGDMLTCTYDKDRLCKIESSNGDFLGLHYNPEGKIREVYTRDGRRVSYSYDSRGDLTKVILPNTAAIIYEYDQLHRIFRETKPHGKVLENVYENGKVKEQRSPMGPQQEMIVTATFAYGDNLTTVTDSRGGKTTYKIFQKQIYKITDPEGYQILQSWFIDENSWFDPVVEKVMSWNKPGGWPRSLKASTDKRGLTTHYLYDKNGNPKEIQLSGKDLTGSGETSITKKLTYNAQNLCILEEVLNNKTVTTYDSNFLYLPRKVERFFGNALFSTVELTYNSLGQVEKEDSCGAVTLLEYNKRGFLRKKTQLTGSDDPNVVTEYSYNNQGQCISVTTESYIQDVGYDIMGNAISSQLFSPSGILLSATYADYNLNNQPNWKQAENAKNVVFFDYHASGALKASRQTLSPSNTVAYTLYDYDSCGNLFQEIDPRGYCTERNYDLLGRLKKETKNQHSTHFTYEPGGLIETITSPSGAKTKRSYTTNGLLKEEIYPDGTKNAVIYDFFGRPVKETKNDIAWIIEYDDPNHRVTRTHLETKEKEISEFDTRGNLVCFTDRAGYTFEKTYDALGRIKSETTPSGEKTSWNYQGDTVICTRANGEKETKRYEGNHVAESETVDAKGHLIAHSTFRYDPENDIQETVRGNQITTTWLNAFGQPIKVQIGEITTTYKYDACGNCITSIDGEGRTTIQKFDPLGRMSLKEMPDGSIITYDYDPDSNLSECRLPNNVLWIASYDSMGRKYHEELQAGGQTSQRWKHIYENGYLKETIDPMQRSHIFKYDAHGRLEQENVDGWRRSYTYDPRGLLSTAEQIEELGSSWLWGQNKENSRVERTYDPDGRLELERTYLNSNLLQQTTQKWGRSSRSLQIGDHTRDFIYHNNQLAHVLTRNIETVAKLSIMV